MFKPIDAGLPDWRKKVNAFFEAGNKLTTQQQRVMDYLEAGHTLTNMVALTALGVGSLSSRVAELRKIGYPILTRTAESHDSRKFLKYDLVVIDNTPPKETLV